MMIIRGGIRKISPVYSRLELGTAGRLIFLAP
jgi:hypothetical protein